MSGWLQTYYAQSLWALQPADRLMYGRQVGFRACPIVRYNLGMRQRVVHIKIQGWGKLHTGGKTTKHMSDNFKQAKGSFTPDIIAELQSAAPAPPVL